MSEPNIYENVDKYKGKVKYRNLDPELQRMIASGGSGGTGGSYDDTEIRNQIEQLEENLEEYTDKYADLSTKINNAATITDLENYRKNSVDITYFDLDADLKRRIDNGGGSSGEIGGDFSQISQDVNNLKSRVSINEINIHTNATNIDNISEQFNNFKQSTENKNVIQDNTITEHDNRITQLENTIAQGIDIDITDLSPEIKSKIEKIDTLSNNLQTLEQQVSTNVKHIETNIENIDVNRTNIESLSLQLEAVSSSTNESIQELSNDFDEYKNQIQEEIDNLNNKTVDLSPLQEQINTNKNDIAQNKDDIAAFQNNLNDLQEQTDTSIDQLTNTINNNYNDLREEISQISGIETDLSSLVQQVTQNTNNITQNKNNIIVNQQDIETNKNTISALNSSLGSYKVSTNNLLGSLSNNLNDSNSRIQELENYRDNLSIDNIIQQNSSIDNPDAGKITENNLNSSLVEKINDITEISDQLNTVNNIITSIGSLIDGDNGNFAYKNSGLISTKNIIYLLFIANTESDIEEFKKYGTSIIYDKTNDIVYSATVNEDLEEEEEINGFKEDVTYDPQNISLTELDEGFQNSLVNFCLLFDKQNQILYFNCNAIFTKILDFNGVNLKGNWNICVDEGTNTLQVKYNNDCIQAWSASDDIDALNISTNSIDTQMQSDIDTKITFIEKDIVVSSHSIEEIQIDNIWQLIPYIKVLVLDNDTDSLTNGLYVDNYSLCTVAYTDNEIKIANNSNNQINVKILY